MNDDFNSALSDEERRAIRATAGAEVPPALEDRTVAALTEQGLIRDRQGRGRVKALRALITAAAIVLSFAAGFLVGKKPTELTSASKYMLLMYQENDPNRIEDREDVNEEDYQAIVDEYRLWAEETRDAGQLVSAEKFEDMVRILTADSRATEFPAGRILGGYFLVQAGSIEQAEKLAATHPHLEYGGQIEVRPLDSDVGARR